MHSDWIKFLQAIEQAKSELGCSQTGAWFRGVSKYRYRLYPKLLRPHSRKIAKRERDIYLEYSDFSDSTSESSWERLVRMQHYGVPTRLLDWTEVFGVALYFALGEKGPSPSIWILNPFILSKAARGGSNDSSIGRFHAEPSLDYYTRFLNTHDWPYAMPFPYRSPKLNPRIRAQRGFFTVHGNDPRPLDAQFRKHIRQVRIPLNAISDGNTFLKYSGIDSLMVFPDLEGFTRRLHERYDP